MKIPVRALNAAGIAAFGSWLDTLSGSAPKALASDPSLTEEVGAKFRLDPDRRFSTSYQLGTYLCLEVFADVEDRFSLLALNGMWSWISLVYIDSLCKKSGQPLAKPHYLDTPRLGYRLIARTAWDLVSLHGECAKLALGSARSPWGEMAEQMTSRQEIYANRSFWPVAKRLYAKSDGTVKAGATSQRTKSARTDPKSKSGLGGVRRLPFTYRQFERTYNLRTMSPDEITSLLPAEYERWRARQDSNL